MTEYHILLEWKRNLPDFNYSTYTRTHKITFGDNHTLYASASPEFHGDPQFMDPEQAFIISLSSCHMLTFLAISSKKEYVIEKYLDKASGEMGKNSLGRVSMTKVILRPVVVFSGKKAPTDNEFQELHDRAHIGCVIANSLADCVELIIRPIMQHIY